ncbi:hypothetical protein P4B35_00620 [Pontiellaceae bacterium B12227]|nr:hypothetical protein [Pontiellaceae bacterium B12227]
MHTLHEHHHQNHHKVSVAALLLGLLLVLAGLTQQLYLKQFLYHPLEGYMLVAAGGALFLRSLRPPLGFVRLISTPAGGACLGACPLFFDAASAEPPWICIGLILAGMILLGGSFTARVKIHHHKHA